MKRSSGNNCNKRRKEERRLPGEEEENERSEAKRMLATRAKQEMNEVGSEKNSEQEEG